LETGRGRGADPPRPFPFQAQGCFSPCASRWAADRVGEGGAQDCPVVDPQSVIRSPSPDALRTPLSLSRGEEGSRKSWTYSAAGASSDGSLYLSVTFHRPSTTGRNWAVLRGSTP